MIMESQIVKLLGFLITFFLKNFNEFLNTVVTIFPLNFVFSDDL